MRKSPAGEARTDCTLSFKQGNNATQFKEVLNLYATPGAVVADTTWGKGAFWTDIPEGTYQVLATDLLTGVDARKLPYEDQTVDVVVFDPPYMHSSGGTSYQSGTNTAFSDHYRNNERVGGHEAVLGLYFEASTEAFRVLRDTGVYIVKTQDEVCANQQRLTHVEIINHLQLTGWICEDLFVLARTGRPVTARIVKQIHARKAHSYFLIFRKAPPVGRKVWKGPKTG